MRAATLAATLAVLATAAPGAGTGGAGNYYPPPAALGGWRALVARNVTPTPAEKQTIRAFAGLDWDLLEAAWNYDPAGNINKQNYLIIRNGWIAGEWGDGLSHDVASCTKSFTSMAMARLFEMSDAGAFAKTIGLEDFAHSYLPASWSQGQPEKLNVKIKHLMTMCSGIEPNDSPKTTSAWLNTILALPMVAPPETDWVYASAPVDLLSLIVEDVTGQTLSQFFQSEIADPLGATTFAWSTMGASSTASAYASVDARDMARLAYLAMRGGTWENASGTHVIANASRMATLTQWAPFLAGTTYGTQLKFPNDPQSHLRYGYLWWTNRLQNSFVGATVPADAYYMAGHRTTFCMVIPSLDMIIVCQQQTLSPSQGGPGWDDAIFAGILARVMNAVVDHPENYCTAGVSSNGCSATLSVSGTASASATSGFFLSAAGVEGDKDGLFFYGKNGRQANSWGNGNSYQCVVPPLIRAGLLSGTGTPGVCDGAFSQDFNALWCATCPKPAKNPGAGSIVQAQLWYRDPQNTSNQTTGMSDAIEFVVCP